MNWARWIIYFRGEHSSSKWHVIAGKGLTLCGKKFAWGLHAERENPKRLRCSRCVKAQARSSEPSA